MAHEDLNGLLEALLPFAQQMLSKHGEFYPFGASMDLVGQINCVSAYDGDEHLESQELIEMMTAGFRTEAVAGRIRAAAICADVRIVPPGQTEKTDAICVSAEHENGEALDAYVPYRKGFLGRYKYGEIFAARRQPQFFVGRQSGM
jgi:hypothetical protein